MMKGDTVSFSSRATPVSSGHPPVAVVVVVVILQPCHTSLLRSPKVGAMTSRRAETHQWRQSRHGTCILRVALASGGRHRSASQLYGTFGLVRIFLPPCLEK
jgi:hypothetical protein